MNADQGILYCQAGSEGYAFWSRDVRHVERAEHLRPDASGDGRAGVLMLGEYQVPVFSLAALFGRRVEQPARAERHIAVTGDRHNLVGWLVDRVARADHRVPDIAPLPSLVGRPATTWFEGAVNIGDLGAALLLAPHGLNPLAPAAPRRGGTTAVEPLPPNPATEPVAVVFSTSVLPPTAARRYALSGRQIAAIVQPAPPIALPGSTDHVAGFIWWRGAVVPVIDFRDPDDRAADPHRRRLIAQCGARHGGAFVAFSIDAEVLMCRPEPAHRQLRDLPCPSFASGIFDVNGDAVALLDLDLLLDTEASGLRDGDAVLPNLLVERAAGNAETPRRPVDPPALLV